MRYKIPLVVALLFGVIVIILAQFSIPTLFDADGYLHIRMAEFIKIHGLRYDFHWAKYSVFAKNFADKDLFYHILIIPFTYFKNIFFGAKIAACIFAIFLFFSFYWILKRYCIKKIIPVFLVSLFLSSSFISALCRPRPMIFTIPLILFYVHFLIRKKPWVIFAITAIYTLTHVSAPFLLFFAILCEFIRFVDEKEFAWRNCIATASGLLIGFLIHPNFPNNLLVFYLNGILVSIFALKWGLELGAEFFPLDTREFVLFYPFLFLTAILFIALGASKNNKIQTATKMWMAIAGFFFVFSFFSKRYLIYSYPLALVALAAYISDWWYSGQRLVILKQNKIIKYLAIAFVCFIFVFVGLRAYKDFRDLATAENYYNSHFEGVGKWMSENIPAGQVVFHSNWSDSQYFIGLNPKNDYFVTLDPIYMYYWNPEKYKLYRDISFGRSSDPYASLKEDFGVEYGYVGKNYFSGLINQIRKDSRFEILGENNLGLVFRLK